MGYNNIVVEVVSQLMRVIAMVIIVSIIVIAIKTPNCTPKVWVPSVFYPQGPAVQ
jgi:hypothetical protein